jgi:DNA polymerase-3 subunit epsilon
LLDSELLAEVYVELVGGKQAALGFEAVVASVTGTEVEAVMIETVIVARPSPLPPRLSEAELAAHAGLVAGLGDKAIWKKLLQPQG